MDTIASKDHSNVIVENQRGITLLGYPFFSPKILLPRFDPSNFQMMNSEKGTLNDIRGSHRSVKDVFPLDAGEEVGRWFVDMRYGDVDDQGWVYSWNFNHGRWRGRKGLVRRRIWVRHTMDPRSSINDRGIERGYHRPVRGQREEEEEEEGEEEKGEDDEVSALIALLQKQLLDRHKFEILQKHDKSIFRDERLRQTVEGCFQYTSSKHKFQEWLKQK